jgi:hypothetical protein
MKSILGMLFICGALTTTIAQTNPRQTVHLLEPGTNGNTLELTIANPTKINIMKGVEVRLLGNPTRLNFTSKFLTIDTLAPVAERAVQFTFEVVRDAPLNRLDTIDFSISDQLGNHWSKSVIVKYKGPTKFTLDQNFPNPFNPSTTINYDLPRDVRVSLKLYNTLGQEVATLVNEEQQAGYKSVVWNGTGFASGMYFYRLQAGEFVDVRKLLLLK